MSYINHINVNIYLKKYNFIFLKNMINLYEFPIMFSIRVMHWRNM